MAWLLLSQMTLLAEEVLLIVSSSSARIKSCYELTPEWHCGPLSLQLHTACLCCVNATFGKSMRCVR